MPHVQTAHDAAASLGTPLRLAAAVAVGLAFAASAHGQEPRWSALVAVGPDSDSRVPRDWLALIQRHQAGAGVAVVGTASLGRVLALSSQNIDRDDLVNLARVGAHLTRARAHTAQLAEADALTELVAADRRLQSLLHLPASSAFYVEVQTAIGLVAAHAQRITLAEAAQRRAAVIDPSRGVRAAEAAPRWVERAREIAREVATAPVGEIDLNTVPTGARVYLDDTFVGTAPTTLRATRGTHVLRLEADGYRSFGVLLPVDAGVRPAVHLALVRDPVVAALSELTNAATSADPVLARRALGALQALGAPIDAVWLLRTNPARADRALVTRCDVDLCEPPRRLELDTTDTGAASYGQALDPAGLGRDPGPRDRDWLSAAPLSMAPAAPAPESSVWWQRWYVWTAAAAVVAGGVALGVAAADEPDSQRLRVTIEP